MIRLNLELFGGRGASVGGGGGSKMGGYVKASSDGTLDRTKPRTIETRYIEGRGWQRGRYDDEVLEAKTDGNGNVSFQYAKADNYEKTAKTNKTNHVTYTVSHGAVNGETFGINWDKVKSISGQTYNLREEAKKHGLKWDGATKTWRRK